MSYKALDPLVDQGVRVGVYQRNDHRLVAEVLLYLQIRVGTVLPQAVTRSIQKVGEFLV